MSNALRYDALLVRDLADELNRTLAGARLDALLLDRASLRVTLQTSPRRRSAPATPSLLWQLHPESGHLTSVAHDRSQGGVQIAPSTHVARVHSPPDERVILFDLALAGDAPAGAARRIIIELVTNQWNAIAVGAEERIAGVLRERETRGRVLRAGAPYELPSRSSRAGATAPIDRSDWHEALGGVPTGERISALLRFAAYTSPLNAAAIIGSADVTTEPAALDQALDRYNELVWTGERTPVLLRLNGHWQPYIRLAPDRPAAQEDGGTRNAVTGTCAPDETDAAVEPVATLVEAFALAATRSAAAPSDTTDVDPALTALARRIESLDRRADRLREEQAGASAEAGLLRRQADLLLAQLHAVERGAESVTLDDFAGGTVDVALDPTRSASDNAARLYDAARKRDRAAARIPGLLSAAAQERARTEQLIARVRAGECGAEELERIVARRRMTPGDDGPSLPYREYRTTGGIEVRVGRGSKANDELTFRHSSPNDVWLHARDVAGAHVILRWNRTDENPPATSIAQAAVLAALFSRARTSGTVAVDWTRRKYVRKPRKAAPGLVIPERVSTVFVAPDAAMEEKMRVEL